MEYALIEECHPSKSLSRYIGWAMGDDQSPIEGSTALARRGVIHQNQELGIPELRKSSPCSLRLTSDVSAQAGLFPFKGDFFVFRPRGSGN
ncbi:MAG: hypothetical protein GVY07_16320 [Bacteroidetes bacterium]|nr:hypothetical protein [Bacteroidota bacterium]